ncbi:uncharacterized protein PV09_07657 [Verruconis gallopava]|uniref:MARVEL domain-containing protein n=1 Tax=Verruconis gallopava TaxID=253628 RepID=A0A0D1YJ54_9PEZI|nr:uncharacterized protein PV09_07657 [Verruconis gallopava]KIW00912.1 hypothetical protein PV09_07657 [Verruconis gallopava]
MAAASYYSSLAEDGSYRPYRPYGHMSQGSSSSLKPLTIVTNNYENDAWYDEHQQLSYADSRLKRRIRVLRVIQRVLAALISIAALVPITMTLHKYLSTRGIIRSAPDGKGGTIERSAWALKTKSWPTYMYFSMAVASTFVHLGVLTGYLWSIRAANRIDTIGTTIQTIEIVGQLVLWIVVAAIYKYEKEITEDGKHNDLWGWTCSGPASALQQTFKDVVSFDSYCNIQTSSWYAGLVQVGALILSLSIVILAWKRRKSKKNVRRSAARAAEGREDYRHQNV